MIEAYILINLKPGKEKDFLNFLDNELRNVVIDRAIVYGEYDAILKVKVDSFDVLRNTVVEKLRRQEYIEKTITLIIAK